LVPMKEFFYLGSVGTSGQLFSDNTINILNIHIRCIAPNR